MKRAQISIETEGDIDQITAYTKNAWGLRQAGRYLDQLEDGFHLLAQHPSVGRPCPSIQAGLRRFEIGKHVVFNRTEPGSIRIIRILHQQMIPAKAHFEQ